MNEEIKQEVPNEVQLGIFIEKERNKAIGYLRKHLSLIEEDAEDVFQDSCLALFNNIKNGKLQSLTSTLSTYLLKICINQGLKIINKSKSIIPFEQQIEITQKDEYSESKIDELLGFGDDGSITIEQKKIMHNIVQDLPYPCEEILWYYYGDDLSTQTIAELLNYSNSRTVITTKSRCMSKLKERFNRIKEEFYAQ